MVPGAIFSLGERWAGMLVYLTFGCHGMWVYDQGQDFVTIIAYRDALYAERPPTNFYEL